LVSFLNTEILYQNSRNFPQKLKAALTNAICGENHRFSHVYRPVLRCYNWRELLIRVAQPVEGLFMAFYKAIVTCLVLLPLVACTSAQEHRAAVANQDKDRLTVGTVQREIRNGMTSAQVVEVLGAPNMVTTDEKRRETWVYDKISTERVYSTSSGGLGLVFGGVGAGILGGLGGSGSADAGAASTTQRTLTIIVKFDEAGKVRDYAYRSSSF
jgi:outer membrane protein assembly factor BamE (lipoprotein component of BamABCDE complex)